MPGVGISFWIWTWCSTLAMDGHDEKVAAVKAVWKLLPPTLSGSTFLLQAPPKQNACVSPTGPSCSLGGWDRACHTMRLLLCLANLGNTNREGARFAPLAARCFCSSWNGGALTPAKSLHSTSLNEAFEQLWEIGGLIKSKMERDLKTSSSSVFLRLWSARHQETVCESNAKSLL